MGDLVAHRHGDLVVGQLELVEQPGIESDLAARHAERIDLPGADQVDLPLPLPRALVPACGLRQQPLADRAQAHQLRVVGGGQCMLGDGFPLELLVFLRGLLLDGLDRHDLAHGRAAAVQPDAANLAVLRLGGQAPGHGRRHRGQRQRADQPVTGRTLNTLQAAEHLRFLGRSGRPGRRIGDPRQRCRAACGGQANR
ncbi:hypothetical protein D3C72_1688290 [compost metagenome]